MDVLSRLDNKDKSTSQPASREDVVSLLRTIDGQPEVEDFAVDGLNAAGPLFMVCVHLLVPMTLMRNPEEFAEKARRTPQNTAFKEDPSPRRMRDFILNSITKRRRPTSGGSIWDSVEDEYEGEGPHGSSRGRAAHGRRRSRSRTPLPSLWEEQEAPVSEEEPERQGPSTRSPHVSRKRRNTSPPASSTPSSSPEIFTQADPVPGPAASKWRRPLQPPRASTPKPRTKPATIRAAAPSSRSTSSDSSSSSDEEPAPKKQAQKPPVKAMTNKGKSLAQSAKQRPAAAKPTVSGSKAAAKKVSSSSSCSESSSDEAPARKKSPKKTAASAASSSSAKKSSASKPPSSKAKLSTGGPKDKPKAKDSNKA